MELYIYNSESVATKVNIGDKEILFINVILISGDEIIRVYYKDQTTETYDSGRMRFHNLYDYSYILLPEDIEEWSLLEELNDEIPISRIHWAETKWKEIEVKNE